jgi:hypothetical protein
VAMEEEDEIIFKALLQLLTIESVSKVFKKQRLDEDFIELNSDKEVEEEILLLVVQNKFCT